VRRVLVIKTGTTLPELRPRRGDYEDWIVERLGLPWERIELVVVYEGETLPDPHEPAGVVVTGSSALVSAREPWSERAAAWLREVVATGTPLLGICYGHQLLAHALGGRVGRNPRGREIGTVALELHAAAREDPLLGGLPAQLKVQATHVESVLELPPGARLLASSATDPHQAFACGERAWGVQFGGSHLSGGAPRGDPRGGDRSGVARAGGRGEPPRHAAAAPLRGAAPRLRHGGSRGDRMAA